jgi:RNA 2',3'-cyclic 3'-phosphodiesterase
MAENRRPRLFAGIALEASVREECAQIQRRLQRAGLNAKYELEEKLHITLAFLGNVDPRRVDQVERVFTAETKTANAFVLSLDRVGAFPNERRPRIVWVGSRAQHPLFRALSQRLRRAYTELGFTFENDAVAHVTIARVKGGGNHPVPMFDLEPIEVPVDEIALFESIPAETTTRYVVRRTARLL